MTVAPDLSTIRDAAARILVVDDEKSIRSCVRAFLLAAGYAAETAEDADGAERLLAEGGFDVVVSDIVLPGLSGMALLQRIRKSAERVQVIMMTGEPIVDTAAEAMRAGACDYLSKPVGKEAMLRSVANAVRIKRLDDERRRLADENAAYQQDLERLVRERTQKIETALGNWKEATEGTILAMALAIECRDPYTAGHQQRVADLGRAIARSMGLPDTEVAAVKTQIWIAISVYVLIAILRKRLRLQHSPYTILQILSITLFEKAPILKALAQHPPK